jgi:sulfite reductase beta subunit-like hemoprotein
VLQERGVDWFRFELGRRLGAQLQPTRSFQFDRQGDALGWHQQYDGNYFLGIYVEAGRVKDTPQCRLKTGLREAVQQFQPEVRLTPSQNILLTNIQPGDWEKVASLLAAHAIAVERPGKPIRRSAMACPALPTCGQALAESERALPEILTRLEQLLEEVGLAQEPVILRMTGCPNGCDRPLMGEIGLVGKVPGKYNLYLGGSCGGARLNRLFRQSVSLDHVVSELRPVLQRFSGERLPGERFGDYCHRAVLAEGAPQTTS